MIVDEMKRLVAEEAGKIREFATQEERNWLNVEETNPYSTDLNIYGQMTGDTDSQRAFDLLMNCASHHKPTEKGCDPIEVILSDVGQNTLVYSAFEFYISHPDANIPSLIAYLRGETDILEL
jgi:small-conductance mechanosensitive channel